MKMKYTEPLTVKVTKINKIYHCRLFRNGKLFDESKCEQKSDIGRTCRDMLRWYDKLGCEPYSQWADWSRHNNELSYRQNYTKAGKMENIFKTV
jgi:hypothetical protein